MKSLTRRTALKQMGIAGSGLALAPSLFATDRLPEDRKLGVALVGLGNYATIMLGPALKETQHCYLAGLVTGTPAKADKWAKEYNVPQKNIYNYETFDQIADNDEIDIIYIVLPNFMHAEYTIRAAEAGKHVICEKPMALTSAECEEMIAACKKADRILSIGYRLQYERHHQEVMRLGQNKVHGPIHLIESGLAYRVRRPGIWRLDKEKGGGGAIMDLGVYCIQAARYTTGKEPISVTAQAYTYDSEWFKDIHETVMWQMEFPGGTIAHAVTSYSTYVDRHFVSAEKGWFECQPSFNGRGTSGRTHEGPMDLPQVSQQATQMDDVASSIKEKRSPLVTGEEGLTDLRLIEAILSAADNGRKVML
ncbi:MAG: Gfo/Idh/MocA family oxidoreductase [Bacteroidota bacterium]